MRIVLWVLLGVALIISSWYVWMYRMHAGKSMHRGAERHMSGGAPIVKELIIPDFNADELSGKVSYDDNCSACHGENAAGVDGAGPPLVHKIYEPSHHGDGAFLVAARSGVRSHHWRFGDMPPVEGVTDQELSEIIAYVRKMQRANGIF